MINKIDKINNITFGQLQKINKPKQDNKSVENPQMSQVSKIMIGATAVAGVTAFIIAGRKGKLGGKLQNLLGGVEHSPIKKTDLGNNLDGLKKPTAQKSDLGNNLGEVESSTLKNQDICNNLDGAEQEIGKNLDFDNNIDVPKPIETSDEVPIVKTLETEASVENIRQRLLNNVQINSESIDKSLKTKEKIDSWNVDDMKKYYRQLSLNSVDELIKNKSNKELFDYIGKLDGDLKLEAIDKYLNAFKKGEITLEQCVLSYLSTLNVRYKDGYPVIYCSRNDYKFFEEIDKIADKFINLAKENPEYSDDLFKLVNSDLQYHVRCRLLERMIDAGVKPKNISVYDRGQLQNMWFYANKESLNLPEEDVRLYQKIFKYDASLKIDKDLAEYFTYMIKNNPKISQAIQMKPEEMIEIINKNIGGTVEPIPFRVENKRPTVRIGTEHQDHHGFNGWNSYVDKMKSPEELKRLQQVDDEFRHLIPQDHECIVYRGRTRRTNDKSQVDFDIINKAKIGDVVIPHSAYSYSGFDSVLAENWVGFGDNIETMLMEIRTPVGARLSCNTEHGGEAVFPRNSAYKLISKETKMFKNRYSDEQYPVNYVVLEYILPKNV